ncbi:MAG: hypothetical protein JW843_12595 [Candidatus Aminicenantes bacterium]|nr:hypothetical protein [Candidatus Aminicenantes bacterium]
MHTTRMTKTAIVLLFLAAGYLPAQQVSSLLPGVDGWSAAEPPQTYVPETLFEYINGAAENFLSYNFIELAVGRYRGAGGKAEMTVEIYDMGAPDHAFGIYGSERYPESRFLPFGVQGYIEDEVLNFFSGRYYVKLMVYEAGDRTSESLKAFASAVAKGIAEPGTFPLPVRAFAPAGRVANSEKFILRDFLGLAFLTRGYVATYRTAESGEFDAFVIETPLPEQAAKTLAAIAGHFAKGAGLDPASGEIIRLKDPYLENILAVKEGRYVVGAVKVTDGAMETAEKTIRGTAKALSGK